MSISDDFSNYAKSDDGVKNGKRGYIRLIWKETELEAAHFSALESFEDYETIKPTLLRIVEDCTTSEFRKNMYLKFLVHFEDDVKQNQAFQSWLASVNAFVDMDETKREFLAQYITRVLRGDLCIPHRTPIEALTLLKSSKPASNWDQQFLKLENLCANMGI